MKLFKEKIAVLKVKPLIGDPDTMTHLPDPLSLYMPPSFDEEEENSQPASSFDDQRNMSVTAESYCEDDLSSECSSFSGYFEFYLFDIHLVSLCDVYSEFIHLE